MVTRAMVPESACCMNSLKFSVRGRTGLKLGRKIPDEHAEDDERHPEQQTLQRRVQAEPPKALSFKISTACAGSVTRKASSIPYPATQTIRSILSTTIGTVSRRGACHLPVHEKVLQLLPAIQPDRPKSVARDADFVRPNFRRRGPRAPARRDCQQLRDHRCPRLHRRARLRRQRAAPQQKGDTRPPGARPLLEWTADTGNVRFLRDGPPDCPDWPTC